MIGTYVKIEQNTSFCSRFPASHTILLPSCFDVLFLYSLFFSQGAQGEKLGTHWLPLSKPTFLGLFDKWVSATTPREELLLLTAAVAGASFPDTQLNSVWFCSLLLSHYTTKLGLDQKTQFGKQKKFEVSSWIRMILRDFIKIEGIRFFFSFYCWTITFFVDNLLPKLIWQKNRLDSTLIS